ncbi:periodic tryptophan protein 1 homolog [Palaemon carinicauda]|uniref:periodic tryptophan protein 1 homolog n=1 Tax=Palaemon carinicauda TaxID=392227 RepID=UPI0035B6301D
MDELPKENLNFITCAVWVPHGIAKTNPEKVEISKDDLARIISETKDEVEELEEIENEGGRGSAEVPDDAAMEVDEEGAENKQEGEDDEKGEAEAKHVSRKNDDVLDFETKYVMKDYDDGEEDDNVNKLLQLGKMAIHASSDDDPFITVKDKDDDDSEEENHEILPSDNLIAVGHVEGDAAILEVYVYNADTSDQGCLYVHHDILLPAVPLCMEWLNYDPCDEQLKPGNLVAIGSMSPVIEVWDLDLVDCLEPAYKLGKKGKKKKKIPGVGHKDAVLSLAWNTYAEHVLASGSVDQTVILWDLQYGSVAQQLTPFKEKVQSLKWHHTEPHSLLTGACDNTVRLFDCNDTDSFKSWKLDGEIECVLWNKQTGHPYHCLASTDKGTVFGIDIRQEKPLWTLNAHRDGCTGLQTSSQCPGCLVTVSADNTVKVWDILGEEPKLIKESNPKLGVLHCLSPCPDLPFVFCMGGDNRDNNFKVWDIRQSKKVRTTFCNRVGLPADENEIGSDDETETVNKGKGNAYGESSASVAKPGVVLLDDDSTENTPTERKPKKFGKKKGGHLDNKRWRR